MNVVEVVSKIAEVIHEMHGPDKPFSESNLISRIFPERFRFVFAENLETKFEIELEIEEISAWTDLTDVKNSVLNQVTARAEIPPVTVVAPINRIEHKDVEDFRNGNYTLRTAFEQYQHIALKSAIYPGKGTPFGLMYTALGLAEAGEVQNKVKKAFRDDGIMSFGPLNDEGGGFYANQLVRYGQITPERKDQIVKELRGLLWYMAATAEEIGTTLHKIALGNLEELCGRTDRGTLGGDGDDR